MIDHHGYAGEILRVDLSSGEVTSTPTPAYAPSFLGGRGIAARIYWEEVPPELGALDPENRLVQAWAWYSLDDDQFEGYTSHSHLFNPDTKQLTALGRAYRDYTASLP